ncbi:flavin reductase family protein [Candidatus Pantoea formicae]|uniref:flavin reductase family protein n=1 Tax=Candidatus Pantoea formicae TaxID=2608355 RepID=UPI003ED92792
MTDSLLMPGIADAYRGGMRQLAAGVCLITSADQQQPGGMIATAVTSVSAEPPTLLVCVNRNASMFELIQRSSHFCVNVLAADALGLVDIFSTAARRAERFATGEWHQDAEGSPVAADALVAFSCKLINTVDWHTHAIFLGEVTHVAHPNSDGQPLLYHDRAFHQLSAL